MMIDMPLKTKNNNQLGDFFLVLRTSIDKIRENGFELTKKTGRRYPAKTITDADYADDISDTGKYTQPSRNTTA